MILKKIASFIVEQVKYNYKMDCLLKEVWRTDIKVNGGKLTFLD